MSIRRIVMLALVVVLAGCHDRRPPNILVIVADTLRADRLATYGNTEGFTPFIDSLATGAHVFRHAHAESPWTLPSVATILTSRFASQHGVLKRDSVLPDTDERREDGRRGAARRHGQGPPACRRVRELTATWIVAAVLARSV